MKPSNILTGFAGFYLFMVLLKDGTLPQLVTNAATTVSTFAKGIRPITNVG